MRDAVAAIALKRLQRQPPTNNRHSVAQVYALFSKTGHVQRVIMGLDSQRKTPCGFCFVVYDRREVRLRAFDRSNACMAAYAWCMHAAHGARSCRLHVVG